MDILKLKQLLEDNLHNLNLLENRLYKKNRELFKLLVKNNISRMEDEVFNSNQNFYLKLEVKYVEEHSIITRISTFNNNEELQELIEIVKTENEERVEYSKYILKYIYDIENIENIIMNCFKDLLG